MTIIKQKTISVGNRSQTIALKKLKNQMDSGGEWMYLIVDKDTGNRIEDPFTNKRRAMQEFNTSVNDIERGMESAQSGGGGLFGAGGGSARVGGDLGFLGESERDDDDDDPYVPESLF